MEQTNAVQENKRPTFLTVICILTFIGSGLGVLGGLIGLLLTGMADSLTSIPGLGAAISNAAIGGVTYTIIGLLLSGASLFGALQMWKLKKMGFFIYLIAQILMLIVPFIFLPSIFAMAGLIFNILFTAGFIVMYAVNLKHLK